MITLTYIEVARFWMSVEIDRSSKILIKQKKYLGNCWKWKGSFFQSGYGRFYIHQKPHRAHRIAYQIAFHEIPDDKLVCHMCDNPSCVNPLHLFLRTSKENTDDMISKGRLNRSRGQNKGVSYRKETGRWRARYMLNYENILVGEFDTEQEALESLKKAREAHPYCAYSRGR